MSKSFEYKALDEVKPDTKSEINDTKQPIETSKGPTIATDAKDVEREFALGMRYRTADSLQIISNMHFMTAWRGGDHRVHFYLGLCHENGLSKYVQDQVHVVFSAKIYRNFYNTCLREIFANPYCVIKYDRIAAIYHYTESAKRGEMNSY